MTNQPIGSSGFTPPPTLAAMTFSPQGWGRVAQVAKITTPVLAARTPQSERVKAIFQSGPSKPGPTIHIDLTKGDSIMHVGTATRGGATTRGGPAVRGVPGTRGGLATRGSPSRTEVLEPVEQQLIRPLK
jgi:hypothetical protein